MKVALVFDDWRKCGKSVYQTSVGVDLSMGQFHSGTTFEADIALDQEGATELASALRNGLTPVWEMHERKD